MRRFAFLALAGACAAGQVQAGFSIEGLPAVSSDRSMLGERVPYQGEAKANFKSSGAKLEPRQARYKDAQLLVDLAYKPVTQRGSGHADRVDGFADNVPFATAISMILPSGWQLYQAKELSKREVPETVSYIGGKAWPDVLEQLGERYVLSFHIDWYDRTVMMSKGRVSPVQQASRIRIIAEPAPAPKAKALTVAKNESKGTSTAKSKAVTDGKSLKGETASGLPKPILKDAGAGSGAKAAPATTKDIANTAPAKVAPPPMMNMQVRSGTLYENVARLSKENGWAAPSWGIDGDYRIPAPYSIQAKDFPEAMVKLLMLHPIEADVNTAQRKIYVLKETR